MSKDPNRRSRIVIDAPSARNQRGSRSGRQPAPREGLVAISVIAAATLATFLALFLTSRPYDPINSSVAPQQEVPAGSTVAQPSPKPSPSTSPTTQPNQTASPSQTTEAAKPTIPDDAAIQSQIERALGTDAELSKLDVSTIVEGGRVTLVGSVRSLDLKRRVESVVRAVRGVASLDNQLVVTEATP